MLNYLEQELYVDQVNLKIIAEQFGTPSYVYSQSMIENNWRTFDHAFHRMSHRICYSVKANSNLAILSLLTRLNSGFDIVSIGELERVIKAGADPEKVIFSGVGKNQTEIEQAIQKNIHCFNVESEAELEHIHLIASRLNRVVNIAFRINPNVDPRTHCHISTGLNINKFGIDIEEIIPLSQRLATMPSLRLIGLASHIGSQILELSPFLESINRMLSIYKELMNRGFEIKHLNVGGGLGITYHHEKPPTICEYAEALYEKMHPYPLEIIIEPGRAIIGNAGLLLTKIEYIKLTKHKNFVIVDAGMNDLLRPALYDAWQDILPVSLRKGEKKLYDVVGPVCESADFLGKDRLLDVSIGDLLAINSAGAYGFSMCSNYNSRCRPAEVLVNDSDLYLINRRQTITELFNTEQYEKFPAIIPM